jgi:WD40 repeat protein
LQQIRMAAIHKEAIRALAFSSDNRTLTSVSRDGVVAQWDSDSGKNIGTVNLEAKNPWVAISPDGMRIATCSSGGTIKLWDAVYGQELCTLNREDRAIFAHTCLHFTPDGFQLATAVHTTIMLWDARPWTAQLLARQFERKRRESRANMDSRQ